MCASLLGRLLAACTPADKKPTAAPGRLAPLGPKLPPVLGETVQPLARPGGATYLAGLTEAGEFTIWHLAAGAARWEVLPPGLPATPGLADAQLAPASSADAFWLAWRDAAGAHLRRYDAPGGWQSPLPVAPLPAAPAGSGAYLTLTTDPAGQPYLLLSQPAPAGTPLRLTVLTYDGERWQTLPAPDLGPDVAGPAALAAAPDGLLYLAAVTGADRRVAVLRFWKGRWEPVGPAASFAHTERVQSLSLALSPDTHQPCLRYDDPAANYNTTVARWDGQAWQLLGGRGAVAGETSGLVIGSGDEVFVATLNENHDRPGLRRWDGGRWRPVPDPAPALTNDLFLVPGPDGPLLAYVAQQPDGRTEAVLRHYGPASR